MADRELAFWKKIIRDCRSSGLSVRAYCEKLGISVSKYQYWFRKIQKVHPEWKVPERVDADYSAGPEALFLPVQITTAKKVDDIAVEHFRVELRSGHLIFVPVTVGREQLANLLSALEANS